MKTAGKLVAIGLCAAIAGIAVSARPAAVRAEDEKTQILLDAKASQGQIRAVVRNLENSSTVTYDFGDFKSSSTVSETRSYFKQDWYAKASEGKPTEIWRSYGPISGTTKTSYDGVDDEPIVSETPVEDDRGNKSFILVPDGKKGFKLNHETWADAKAVQAALSDGETDLFPHRKVAVGESWKIADDAVVAPTVVPGGATLKRNSYAVKLQSIETDDRGARVATLDIEADQEWLFEEANEFDADLNTRLTITLNFKGTASVNAATSRLMSCVIEGNGSAKGKLQGQQSTIRTTFREEETVSWGMHIDSPHDNGSEGPEEVSDFYGAAHAKVAKDHVVIARNGQKISRLQVLDTYSKKIVKTIGALPAGVYFNDPALSPSRDRVAFSSNGNNRISISGTNVFILETAGAKLRQVSPLWADGEGVAQALDTGKTGTIKGRLVWYDDELRMDRHDGLMGSVQVDHTSCVAIVDGNGEFTLENVPVGASLLIRASASLPNYSNGKARDQPNILFMRAAGSTVAILAEEGTKDLGDLRIHPPAVDVGYTTPTWSDNTLFLQTGGWSIVERAGSYEGAGEKAVWKQNWEEFDLESQSMMRGGFTASPDGKYLTLVQDSLDGEGGISIFDARTRKKVAGIEAPANLSYSSSGAWMSDGKTWLCTASLDRSLGDDRFGTPALAAVDVGEQQAWLAKAWPEWTGCSIVSIAVGGAEANPKVWLVVHRYDPKTGVTTGDLWSWEPATDITMRLTSLGDVVGVADTGR